MSSNPLAEGVPPLWADRWGEDSFGPFVEVCFDEGLRLPGDRQVVQRFRWIRPGRFVMGSPESEVGRFDNEGPQHEVILTLGFWLADTACTQDLWELVMGGTPCTYLGGRHPVETVSHDDIVGEFFPLLLSCHQFQAFLPTEAQWEFACRAGTEGATYGGDAPVADIGWFYENPELESGRRSTNPVGLKRANSWGLYDMLGNVWEWCSDSMRNYEKGAVEDPKGEGLSRVIRGASCYNTARNMRAAYRDTAQTGARRGNLGFRLALGQDPAPGEGRGAFRI